ncbi:RagB/SusD family nutrient uptake outer membrane protein [Sphingobacterium faecale]|uniref:RagB/SusD family nutrient uptake outer membrane protein n=1 Tax=Sphingobacterium faecale TaxID=2803775 RepID=A0ABS1QY41_9SPHI|nr:RagB/SusD family nutrient uptake outer membrane protein [Sphingobacterium faecale]MBL1407219.1 RagB/SusD family nutrient uptake outer membrane protein [Sphingobacterium faecale]
MNKIIFCGLLMLSSIFIGCNSFLDAKPRKGLVIPEKLEQLLSLMRKENESLQDPTFGELSTDDFYWDTADLNSKPEPVRNAYLWKPANMFGADFLIEWLFHYRFIYYANTVLEQLPNITPSTSELREWNKAKGEALFYRGKFLYDMAIIWSSAYNVPNNDKVLGMPIRLNTNFNEPSYRSSVKDTYAQIIKDIEESIVYLPELPEHVTRPSKLAAKAMAARIYLSMGEYEKALIYAEEVLKVKSELIDFNQLSTTADYPIAIFNKEVIYHSYMQLYMANFYLNPGLLASYSGDDLRRDIYFGYQNNGKIELKGSYYGDAAPFTGLAVDEMYLIAAECQARNTGQDRAKEYMRSLLEKRYKKNTVPILQDLSKTELLDFILQERRKELVFRGLRWGDVKRLNNEGRAVTLERFSQGGNVDYLQANDPRFNLPFPEGVIDLSGMEQNPR